MPYSRERRLFVPEFSYETREERRSKRLCYRAVPGVVFDDIKQVHSSFLSIMYVYAQEIRIQILLLLVR